MTRRADSDRLSAMSESIPRVAVMLDFTFHGAKTFLSGVSAEARRQGGWRILVRESRSDAQIIDATTLGCDGAIVSWIDVPKIRTLARRHIPLVLTDPLPSDPSKLGSLRTAPIVRMDSRAIGVLAAQYFRARGYSHFAYVCETSDFDWSAERRMGFSDTLASAGFACATYQCFSAHERACWHHERPRMIRWLREQPKPIAILAAMDTRARLVIDACNEAGLAVPHEVAVLGVDNDDILCEACHPPLSSIRTGGFTRGEEAARQLARLMNGERLGSTTTVFNPPSIVTRGSTGYAAMSNPFLARGLSYIRDHATTQRTTVADVVQFMRCSPRLAEQLFARHIGHSIKEEIRQIKFNAVCELLQKTNLTINAIAERCGFSCESHLSYRFKCVFGISIREWRKQNAWFNVI